MTLRFDRAGSVHGYATLFIASAAEAGRDTVMA